MSNKEKPLPKPPGTPFGGKKRFEHEEEQASLLADRMAAAAAEGKLEEFLEKELPGSEQARTLARMMLGMTGMMPSGDQPPSPPRGKTEGPLSPEGGAAEQTPSPGEIPGDVAKAIQGGDVKGLMDLLRREHQKRTSGAETVPGEEVPASRSVDQPAIDKDIIDALIRIASDNSVTLDWLILRAIRVYVEEYRKTGKL